MDRNEYNLMVKEASRFNRRLLSLYPDAPVSLFSHFITEPADHSRLLNHFRNRGVRRSARRAAEVGPESFFRRFVMEQGDRDPDMARMYIRAQLGESPELVRAYPEGSRIKDVVKLPRRPSNEDTEFFSSLRKTLEESAKRHHSSESELAALETAPPISTREFIRSYPSSVFGYKGGGHEGRFWEIDRPGWVTRRLNTALAYSSAPTDRSAMFSDIPGRKGSMLLSAIDLSGSRALRRGDTFFTQHVGFPGRADRVQAVHDFVPDAKMPGYSSKNFEAVFPGHEMKGMKHVPFFVSRGRKSPKTYRSIVNMPESDLTGQDYRFSRILDVPAYDRIISGIKNKKQFSDAVLDYMFRRKRVLA